MTVFCDNYGCIFIDEDGFCDCDKLDIIGGVCEGSHHGGRNATENDADKRLQAENAKLRELVRHMYECMSNVDADGNYECYSCEYENTDGGCDFERMMRELGIEVG